MLLHGSAASRALRTLAAGAPLCVTVTLIDGLVLARSAFHHSMNYRSVVLLGTRTARRPTPEAKAAALEAFTEKLVPGRWDAIRWPTRQELKGTKVLSLPIDEASAKVRTGAPVDDAPDYDLDGLGRRRPAQPSTPERRYRTRMRPLPDHVQTYTARSHSPHWQRCASLAASRGDRRLRVATPPSRPPRRRPTPATSRPAAEPVRPRPSSPAPPAAT